MDAAEVKVKLVIDDAAKDTAKHVEQGMQGIAKEAAAAEQGTGKLAKAMELAGMAGKATMAGVAMAAAGAAAALAGVAALGHEAFEASLNEMGEIKKMSSSLMMLTGAGLSETKNVAEGLFGEIEDMGIQVGVATSEVTEAFSDMAAKSNKSVEELQQLTEQMATASRVIPGGMNALSQGMTMMEMGMIRARNPIVQLIAATGTLHGNARNVASQLQKMTPEEQMAKAEEAIGKMANKAKDLPLGYKAITQSIKDIWDNMLEDMGKPIVGAVTKVMGELRDYLLAHKEQIAEVLNSIGERMGEFVTFVSDLVKGLVEVFGDDISNAGQSLEDASESMADYWADMKDNALAIARAMKDVFDELKELWGIIENIRTAGRIVVGVGSLGGTEVARMLGGFDNVFTGKTGNYSIMDMLFQTGARHNIIPPEVDERLQRVNKAFTDISKRDDDLKKLEDSFARMARQAGVSRDQIDKFIEGMHRTREVAVSKDKLAQAFDAAKDIGDETGKYKVGGYELPDGSRLSEITRQQDAYEQLSAFQKAWETASEAHDKAALEYGAGILEKSKFLQHTLLESGAIIDGAFEGLSSHIKDNDLMALILGQEKKRLSDMGKAKGATNDFRGSTFNIKQDFRDQDPDRIAVVFRRDILAAAERRGQARGAFGGM